MSTSKDCNVAIAFQEERLRPLQRLPRPSSVCGAETTKSSSSSASSSPQASSERRSSRRGSGYGREEEREEKMKR